MRWLRTLVPFALRWTSSGSSQRRRGLQLQRLQTYEKTKGNQQNHNLLKSYFQFLFLFSYRPNDGWRFASTIESIFKTNPQKIEKFCLFPIRALHIQLWFFFLYKHTFFTKLFFSSTILKKRNKWSIFWKHWHPKLLTFLFCRIILEEMGVLLQNRLLEVTWKLKE